MKEDVRVDNGHDSWRDVETIGVALELEIGCAEVGLVLGRIGREARRPQVFPDRRLRVAFIAGAEERSRRELGRGLSEEELERVLRRYPGDVPKR